MSDSRTTRIDALESIRGIAAVAVLLSHVFLAFAPPLHRYPPPLLSVLYNGEFAVRVFFVLSGTVLSLAFFRRGSIDTLRSMAIRRYFRLAIPVAASILLACLLRISGGYYNDAAADLMGSPEVAWLRIFDDFKLSVVAVTEAALFGAFFGESGIAYNPVLWTMAVELKGSFLVFGFLALFGSLRNRWVLYMTGICLAVTRDEPYWVDFLAGVAISDLHISGRLQAIVRPTAIPLLVAAALAFALAFADLYVPRKLASIGFPVPEVLATYGQTATAVFFITASLGSPTLRRLLDIAPLAWLGRISFSLYLLHVPLLASLGCGVFVMVLGSGYEKEYAGAAAGAATIVASLVAASASAATVERWSLVLPRQVYDRFFDSPARPVRVKTDPALAGPSLSSS